MFFLFLIKMLVKNKKKRYNSFRRRKERNYDEIYLAIFYSTSVSDLYGLREEDKKIEQTHQTIGKTIERKSRNV